MIIFPARWSGMKMPLHAGSLKKFENSERREEISGISPCIYARISLSSNAG
jgi:hypothetical protein